MRKYKPSSNSPYFDNHEIKIRKGSKHHLSEHGSRLAPISLWATRVAPKLDLKLANLSDHLIQSYMVDLPCEGNFYFEVVLYNEQTTESYIQIGVADINANIEHAETMDYIDQMGNTTCLGVGRTPGGYCFDAISTEALSHEEAKGKAASGTGISVSKIKNFSKWYAPIVQRYIYSS